MGKKLLLYALKPPTEISCKDDTFNPRAKIRNFFDAARKSRKDIAKAIDVSESTISRELRRNCDNRNGSYDYDLAQRKYETRLKLRGRKPVFTKAMKETVISLLEEDYTPEQIKGRSEVEGFAMVSHETIYRWIWDDKRKKGTLYQNLRAYRSFCRLIKTQCSSIGQIAG